MLGWLFGAILVSAFAVVRHAEGLAVRLGEPFGTLVLTLSMSGMEMMMIAAVMYARPRRIFAGARHHARNRDDCIEWAGGRLPAARRVALP